MAIGASLQFSGQKQHPCKAFEGLLLYWRTQELKWFKGHPAMRVYWVKVYKLTAGSYYTNEVKISLKAM